MTSDEPAGGSFAATDFAWTVKHNEFCAHDDTDPLPTDPYGEDGYCCWCGNGRWKHHAPWCRWADAVDALVGLLAGVQGDC